MCCEVSVEQKAQPMPPGARFPDGWTFIIDPTMERHQMHEAPVKGAEGLKIFPPTGSYRYTYNSVETAISQNARVLKDVCPGSFYAHIGVVASRRTLSNYRVVGSRVYCAAKNGKWSWGIIVAKHELKKNIFRYSVSFQVYSVHLLSLF
jgi:hypothetical protein